MKTIWKDAIRPNASKYDTTWEIDVPAPIGSKAISVALQNGIPTVWFEVDTKAAPGRLRLYSVGTGHGALPANARFIGTIIEGEYVWHIYGEI